MFSSFTSHSRAAFPFQMGALISQGLLMMHCGSYWATLALEHKLISCSIPPRINRGPSTCFLSRFCLFLFPPSCLTLSPHPPLRLLHPALLKCTRASACTVNVRVRCINIFESVCTGRMRKYELEGLKQREPSASAGKLENFFRAILRYSSHPRDCSHGWDLPLLWSLIIKLALSYYP